MVIIIGTLASATLFSGEKKEVKEEEILPFVKTLSVERQLNDIDCSQGMVKPLMETTMLAEVSGRVIELSPNFVAGAFVNKGDLLLVIEKTDYVADLRIAEANLTRAKARLSKKALADQAKVDWESVSSGKQNELAARKVQLNEQLADVRQAESQLLRAQKNLARTEVRAPYDGLIKMRDADLGQF